MIEKHPYLVALGERVRALRSRRGMTRKTLAAAAKVSERHLANLETGVGNASVLVLLQVADALQCALAEITGDMTTDSSEWLLIRVLLAQKDETTLRQVRRAIGLALGSPESVGAPSQRIALIGLRGAGKSTLGALLAQALNYPFIELSREIEGLAGCSVAEIQALYGVSGYRRYERQALERVLNTHTQVVIATPGGLVSDTTTFSALLSQCTTVWLQATPEDHMRRVVAQGDMRPMAASKEAMDDLKNILDVRAPFYSKSNLSIDTSAAPQAPTLSELTRSVRAYLSIPCVEQGP